MHKGRNWLLIAVFTLTQIVSGSPVVLAHDVGMNHQHDESSGLQLAQYRLDGDLQPVQYGQDGNTRIDVEPPLIEHDVIKEADADIRQTFIATVVDDEELDSVLFYYRYAGETSYSRYMMMQVSYSSTYIAQIPTDPDTATSIEYYIQARDTSGNRTVRGYAFSPLVRNIVVPSAVAETPATTTDTAAESSEQTATRRLPKAVYIVGGVLLLGLVVGAVGSSGSDAGADCGPPGCRLTLTVNPPY